MEEDETNTVELFDCFQHVVAAMMPKAKSARQNVDRIQHILAHSESFPKKNKYYRMIRERECSGRVRDGGHGEGCGSATQFFIGQPETVSTLSGLSQFKQSLARQLSVFLLAFS